MSRPIEALAWSLKRPCRQTQCKNVHGLRYNRPQRRRLRVYAVVARKGAEVQGVHASVAVEIPARPRATLIVILRGRVEVGGIDFVVVIGVGEQCKFSTAR